MFDALRLTAGEVESLFIGHRLHGRTVPGGLEYGASVAADGTAVIFGRWGNGAGIAKLEGDRLYFVLSSTSYCGNVFRNPGGTKAKENEYLWYSWGWALPFLQIE